MFKSVMHLTFLIAFLFTAADFTDVDAKSSSRSTSRSSSRSRTSTKPSVVKTTRTAGSTLGKSKPAPTKPAPAVQTTRTAGSTLGQPPATKKPESVTTTRTAGSTLGGSKVAPAGTVNKTTSPVDKALSKQTASGKRTYATKNEATAAYKKSLGENQFKTEPATRPSYIPEYRTYNGSRVQTVFYNGRYGYRRNGVFIAYGYDDYYYDDNDLGDFMTGVAIGAALSGNQHRPTVVTTQPRTVVQRETNSNDVKIVLIVIIAIFAVGCIGFFLYRKFNS